MILNIKCRMCGKLVGIDITLEQHAELNSPNRRKIQDILPHHKPAEREMFISETCGECWDKMFEDDDDANNY